MGNSFFKKEMYDTEIALGVNEDVLERIYGDNILPTDALPVEFFFVTDSEAKAVRFKHHLSEAHPTYTKLVVQHYEDNYEVTGLTDPMEMNLSTINHWNQSMWGMGYEFDCKLDGWQVCVTPN